MPDQFRWGSLRWPYPGEFGWPSGATESRYIRYMKTVTLSSIRVEPEFRASVEAVLHAPESLSEFVRRGLQSLASAKRTGLYVDADVVVEMLRAKLAAAREGMANGRKERPAGSR